MNKNLTEDFFFAVVLQAVHHIFTNSIMEFYEEAFSLTYDLTTTHISKNMWEMFKIIYQVSICAQMLLQFDENFSLNLRISLLMYLFLARYLVSGKHFLDS